MLAGTGTPMRSRSREFFLFAVITVLLGDLPAGGSSTTASGTLVGSDVSNSSVSGEEFTDCVSGLWVSGQKNQVLQVGLSRISEDPGDIVSLLLVLEYQAAYSQVGALLGTLSKLEQEAPGVSGSNFESVRPLVMLTVEALRALISAVPAEQLEAEGFKGDISGKPLSFAPIILALERDGFVSESDVPASCLPSQTPLPTAMT